MVAHTIIYQQLVFDHIVEFSKDNTLFAAARENGIKVRLFLICWNTGSVYTRNGKADSWEQLFGDYRQEVLNRLAAARHIVPVYKVNGNNYERPL